MPNPATPSPTVAPPTPAAARPHPLRVAVWEAMAAHFLDTETRHDLPWTALACAEAGLTPEAAVEVWLHEITPAVGFNLWDVAGEWAGWDSEWLVGRVTGFWEERELRPGSWSGLLDRARADPMHGVRVALERCLAHLAALPDAARRRQRTEDLAWIARHCFDFVPEAASALPPAVRQRRQALDAVLVERLLGPALTAGERPAALARVARALAPEAT